MRYFNNPILPVFAVLILMIYSCSKQIDHKDRQVFRYNESKGIATLDPAFAKNQTIIWPVHQLYNGLVQMDRHLRIKPAIAKSWEVSTDGLNYTFHLRNDVFFHDHEVFPGGKGRKVTANDFVYSLKRLYNPEIASPGAWIMNPLDKEKGPEAINDSTLKITLRYPFPAFLGLLTMQYCSVVPREAIDFYKDDFRKNPVGTGPFQLKLWIEGEKLVLVKNPNYFESDSLGNHLPYLDAVAITFVPDKQSEFLEFVKGNTDFLSGVTAANRNELLTSTGTLRKKYRDKIKLLTAPYLNTEYLGILLDTTETGVHTVLAKNRKIRQAINYGFDRKKMMKYLRNNMGTPATGGIIPKGLPGYRKNYIASSYNPDRTRKLLEEAGYPGGKGLPTITLTTTSDYLDLCEFIQHELSESGISIEIEVSTGATFRDMVSNSKLEFFRASWIADYPDAENYLALFYSKNFSPSGPNYTHYQNKEYDQLYEQSLNFNDPRQRRELYHQMDSIIMSDAAIVPLYYDIVVRFTHMNVKNLGTNPLNLLELKKVKKTRK